MAGESPAEEEKATMVREEPYWGPPSEAERAYARATMPGRADGHVIAYREWIIRVKEDGALELRASVFYESWPDGEPMIGIKRPCTVGSGPGIYARKEPVWKTSSILTHSNMHRIKALKIHGSVALWGPIVEHDWGYRARYAYPLSFWVCLLVNVPPLIQEAKQALRSIAAVFGVPYTIYQKMWGQSLIKEEEGGKHYGQSA